MSNLPGSPLPPPPPPPFLPGPTTAVEFDPINPTHPNPNPSSTHTNHAFIISIVVSAIGVILIGLVCFALGYWLRKKLMAPPPPPPPQQSTVHQVPHHSQLDHPCCLHVPGGCSRAASPPPPPPPPQQSTTVHQVPHHSQLDHPCCSHVPGGCSRAPRV